MTTKYQLHQKMLQVTKEANLVFFKSLFIGLLESSHWAISFQPLTFKNSKNSRRKKYTNLSRGYYGAINISNNVVLISIVVFSLIWPNIMPLSCCCCENNWVWWWMMRLVYDFHAWYPIITTVKSNTTRSFTIADSSSSSSYSCLI